MIPASLFLDGPVDPVLCDCGEEIRQMFTLDHGVGGAFEYHIVGGVPYGVATWSRSEVVVADRSFAVRRPASRLLPGQYINPFHASAVCVKCSSLVRYAFTLDENGVVCSVKPLTVPGVSQ